MEKRYFITGGAGFVGSHTVDRLIEAGESVTVYDIKTWKEAENLHDQEGKFAYIEGDICDAKKLEKAMEGHTHVLHLAAIVSVPLSVEDPIGTHNTNVNGTLHVLEAARRHDAKRVVYASSAAVYGEQETFPIREDVALKPLSPYGLHKVINDEYAAIYERQFGLSTMGLRYFNIFGTRQDPSSPYSGVISIFVDRIRQKQDIHIFGDGLATRDFVHVDNIVSANLKALESDARGVCNIGAGTEISILDLVRTLGELSSRSITPIHKEERAGDILKSCAAIDRAREHIGYEIVTDFKTGLGTLVIVE